jgi:hypothetical protein
VKRIRVTIDVDLPDHGSDVDAFTTGLFIAEHCIEDTEMRNSRAQVTGSAVALINASNWPTESGPVL